MNADGTTPSDVIDFKLLLERLEGDLELLRELASLYVAEYPLQLDSLLHAVSSGDLQHVQRAAHKIKGTARGFAAASAEAAAGLLEETTEFGDGVAVLQRAERLSRELRRLHSALEKFLPGV